MKTITTEITINAPINDVWKQLTDFESYPRWNPFITDISGVLEIGDKLKVTISPPNSKSMTFTPRILEVIQGKVFRWKGILWTKGIFDGEHYFELEALSAHQTKMKHGEQFSGLLSLIIFPLIKKNTIEGFGLMNQALKKELENKKELELF